LGEEQNQQLKIRILLRHGQFVQTIGTNCPSRSRRCRSTARLSPKKDGVAIVQTLSIDISLLNQ
jgi:hypothetical protein